MLAFLSWYFVVTIIGWLVFPLAYRIFPVLKDRGYSLARTLGLLLAGYIFWITVSLGLAQNDSSGLFLALSILVGLSGWAAARNSGLINGLVEIQDWVRANIRLVSVVELLFLLAFASWTIVRATNPEALGTEKPMELAFINAIIRSPSFPPNDPWLSGYAISYYYFGYIKTALLAKLTGTPGSLAFNLMIALVFALSATGAYGILYNLLAVRARNSDTSGRRHSLALPLLGPLFLLVVSNLEGFLEVLHRRGLFWVYAPDGGVSSSFWRWLDMKELSQPPVQPLGWIPQRFWWWWRASRVVQDYDLLENFREVIDEFPFFSYLLADLHPHVLAMPFGLLTIAIALNLFSSGWRGEIRLPGLVLNINKSAFLLAAVSLGGMAFLNTWDFPIYVGLVCGAYLLMQVRVQGWEWDRLLEFLVLGLLLGASGGLLYLPFYVGFSSQAGGIAPNLINPTRGAHLWVMFGTLFLPVIAYLLYLWRDKNSRQYWKTGIGLALVAALGFWIFSWLMGLAALERPEVQAFLQSMGNPGLSELFVQATARRLGYIGGLLTLLVILGLSLTILIPSYRSKDEAEPGQVSGTPFGVLMVVFGILLVLVPEFFYLRDLFGSRMNTVFKFYYQAWILLSLAAAFGTAVLLQELRNGWSVAFRFVFALVLIVGLVYPVLSLLNKTNNFQPPFGWTLDSSAHIGRSSPGEAAAIQWLQTAPAGIVAEAVGGSYTGYARISTNTGFQTVLGWIGHEGQWRGGYEEQGSRKDDIERMYSTADWNEAQSIIKQYNIRYIVIGSLERNTYRVNEVKFQRFLPEVFRFGDVVIFATY